MPATTNNIRGPYYEYRHNQTPVQEKNSEYLIEPVWQFIVRQRDLWLCDLLEHQWRTSPLTPPVMVRSLVYRSLNSDKSIRQIVEELIASGMLKGEQTISKSTWCQARSRMPDAILDKLRENILTMAIDRRFGCSRQWHGREVYLVDGSTISMPDEPEPVEAFGYIKGRYGNSRFPTARIVALLHAATRMIAAFRIAPNQISELELFRQMMALIEPGSIWVGDVYYSNTKT